MIKPLIEYLPSFMQNSNIYKSIFEADEVEIIEFEDAIEDLELQLSIDTATWALDIYEKDLGIETDTSKPYSERRSVIKSRERGTGKVDTDLIKSVADAYANGDADVDFNGNIIVTFTSVLGRPPNLEDLIEAIKDIRPAHLLVEYKYKYLVISMVHDTMTINNMESQLLTNFAPFEPVI